MARWRAFAMHTVVGGAALCAAACTMLSGIGDLSIEVDGQTDGGVGGGGDGQTSVPPPDGDGGGGGSSEAGQDGAIGVGAWCASQDPAPTGCLDLDAVTSLDELRLDLRNGELSLDSTASSAPRSLYAVMNDGDSGWAFVVVPVTTAAPHRVSWSFDARLDELRSAHVEFVELEFDYPAGGNCGIQPTMLDGVVYVNEYCAAKYPLPEIQIEHALANIEPGTEWFRISVTIDFDDRTLSASIAAPSVAPKQLPPVTLDDRVQPGRADLRFGISWTPANVSPAHRLRLDNLTYFVD